jgi:hypothetical protein
LRIETVIGRNRLRSKRKKQNYEQPRQETSTIPDGM